MHPATQIIGNQIDQNLRDSAHLSLISPRVELKTVQDLLTSLRGSRYLQMLRTTAGHISAFLNFPVEELAVDVLVDLGPSFRTYLNRRRYKRQAVRSYSNFAAMLLREAKKLGWTPAHSELADAWQPVLAALPKRGCGAIVRYAIRQSRTPSQFCDKDLEAWGQTWLDKGESFGHGAND
jgi:hypothetical protein